MDGVDLERGMASSVQLCNTKQCGGTETFWDSMFAGTFGGIANCVDHSVDDVDCCCEGTGRAVICTGFEMRRGMGTPQGGDRCEEAERGVRGSLTKLGGSDDGCNTAYPRLPGGKDVDLRIATPVDLTNWGIRAGSLMGCATDVGVDGVAPVSE